MHGEAFFNFRSCRVEFHIEIPTLNHGLLLQYVLSTFLHAFLFIIPDLLVAVLFISH